jgi:phosphatidylglycerol:prolipoprotein diacylglycerol transferase
VFIQESAAALYAPLYLLGIFAAGAIAFRAGLRRGIALDGWALTLGAGIVGGVVGSRLLMFDFHSPEPGEKTILGALVGGAAAAFCAARFLRIDGRLALDSLARGAPAGMAIGRVGCFLAGCCAGIPTTLPWGVRYSSPETPGGGGGAAIGLEGVSRHPVQLYEAFLDLAVLYLVARSPFAPRLKRPGAVAAFTTFALALSRFMIEFLRDNAAPAGSLSIVQWVLLATVLPASVSYLLFNRRTVSLVPEVPARVDADGALGGEVAMPWRFMTATVLIVGVVAALGSWLTPIANRRTLP